MLASVDRAGDGVGHAQLAVPRLPADDAHRCGESRVDLR